MIFTETPLKGVFIIDPQRLEDERGFFARTWCEREFAEHKLTAHFVQCNISFNKRKGTLRGLHFQVAPHEEVKLVRCTSGAIYDVIIDLRSDSPTFKCWASFELSAENRRMLYVPNGLAHGFQTLIDNTEVFYQMSEFYSPQFAKGVRWNDMAFGINWPMEPSIISIKDQSYGLFESGDEI